MRNTTQAQRESSKERKGEFLTMVKDLVKIEKEVNPSFESKGNVNPLLISFYQLETGCTDFRTFKAWKEAGYMVRKGAKGYPIFSRPIGKIKEEKGLTTNEGDYSHFGTCYLFNESQVDKVSDPVQTQEVEPGTVKIITHGEDKIAVIGNTKPIKEILRNLGGKFYFNISAWVFSKTELEKVKEGITCLV